ncbi:MAG: hypothetical protein E3K40_06265 [Candidatus Brocadia sp.]|nr:hypothetical protein [Candidatus Brocadia sp.]
MRTRLSTPFLKCELVSKFMIFLVFAGNLCACFISHSCSAQDEYPGNTNDNTSCKENSINVNRFDFYESEFRLPLTTEKLREEIEDNLKVSDNTETKDIKWLNELLETPGFYERLHEKYGHQVSSNIKLIELLKKTEKYRSKEFSKLSKERQYNIKRLNRLILEELYPELTPNIKRHVIVINKDGRLCEPESHGKKLILQGGEKPDSAMQECNDAECNYFDKIRENIEKWDKTIKTNGKQILIFVHGGLNSFENSYERARKLLYCKNRKIPEEI